MLEGPFANWRHGFPTPSFKLWDTFKSLSTLPIPPLKTSNKRSVDYVAERCRRKFHNVWQAQAERAIELLQERRTALISAAVTGKIDVRGYAQTKQEAVA